MQEMIEITICNIYTMSETNITINMITVDIRTGYVKV